MLDIKTDTFIKVVELKSYTAAAAVLHMTQPAVTQHIRKLEMYYGCQLIDSAGHAVRVTQAGELLYEHLSLQYANERSFIKLLRRSVEPLRVGATLSIADYYLPEPFADHMLATGAHIRVIAGNTLRLLELLRTGELDCAFIEGMFDPSMFEKRIFCKARLLPVVCPDHPLLGRQVTLDDLHDYPLVLREPYSGTREVLEIWLHQQDDTPRSFARLIELGSFVLIKQFVQKSFAVTFAYEAVIREELDSGKLCTLDVEGYDLTHKMHFIYRRGDIRHIMLDGFYNDFMAGIHNRE